MTRSALLLLLPLLACTQDITVTRDATCDGVKQPSESTVDAPFDPDGDGYFDANNPGCAATYPAEALDCDEGHSEVHPGATEVACNDLDDDCDEATPDSEDADGDGYACDDCDDADAATNPGAGETECNDRDDDCDPETLDWSDRDGDGANSCEDCDDDVASTHPGGAEILCNLVDDDCNPETPDDPDADGDGSTWCDDDCDDADPDRSPDFDEVCDDEIDNDCDEDVDEGCTLHPGPWSLDRTVSYSCAYGMVNVSFNRVTITDTAPTISVDGGGSQPGIMRGTWTSATTFETENVLTGTCNEYYEFDGTVASETRIDASFTIRFSGSLCLDCRTQSYTLVATR